MAQHKPVSLRVDEITKQERTALKLLSTGEANQSQQLLALSVIVKKLSRAYDLAFVPGATDESAFLAGRGYVGQLITRLLNEPVDKGTDHED